MTLMHATHNTSPEYAGNASLEVEAATGGVTLTLDNLQDGEPELSAALTPMEARALAAMLLQAADDAEGAE